MVQLDTVRTYNKGLFERQSLTAVVAGGTSGIGEYAVRALACTHGKSGQGLRVYIVGRNKGAADAIIADCRKACPAGEFRFMPCSDLACLREVDVVCRDISDAEETGAYGKPPCIDLLIMTQAYFSFGNKLHRQETSEGLDKTLSLLYYSRMRLVDQLLPLLLASSIQGRVVSVFGPGRDSKFFLDDLSLRRPEHFGFNQLGSHNAYMTTYFFEKLAARHPGKLSLSHYFPGLVMTPAFRGEGVPGWFTAVFNSLNPLVQLFCVPPEESGDRVIFHASPRFPARATEVVSDVAAKGANIKIAMSSDGIVGGGAYRTNWDGEAVPLGKGHKLFQNDKVSDKIWDHTMKAFQEISAGGRFLG